MTLTIYAANGLYALAALACPVGMGLMMWMMMRAGRQTGHLPPAQRTPAETDAELAGLRAELDELRAETRDQRRAPTGTPWTP